MMEVTVKKWGIATAGAVLILGIGCSSGILRTDKAQQNEYSAKAAPAASAMETIAQQEQKRNLQLLMARIEILENSSASQQRQIDKLGKRVQLLEENQFNPQHRVMPAHHKQAYGK